ncbi:CsgE family curli-type amyloid fiber assembly protein [Bowmanella denitrificans]|uniref:CsgE family curli-type amyloid fiber assembly protein n=1 Tax=Bowmanella denitrificans TaxID=366582 RepID=UPI00155901B2|nr:CsgE family curli-type amyloid fiber assembly protein [Bowmanella denitrificans]
MSVTRNLLYALLLSLATPSMAEVELGGLLLDNTFSRFGREFYQRLSRLWQDVPQTQNFNVVVKEQVVPRAGTKLTIQLNNQVIYMTYMGRRQSPMEDKVEEAMLALLQAMANARFDSSSADMAENGW